MKLNFPIEVTLSDVQRTIVMHIGKLRQAQNEEAGVKDIKTKGQMNSEAMHIQGFAAEMAFAIAANVMPDLDPHIQSGTVDCKLPSGLTVDVKSTTRSDGNLLEPLSKLKNDEHADICVLVTGEFPLYIDDKGRHRSKKSDPATFTIHGWAFTHELRASIRSAGMSKECYFLHRKELHKVLPLTEAPPDPKVASLNAPAVSLAGF